MRAQYWYAGIESGHRHLTLQGGMMSDWIACSDKLPDIGHRVLVVDGGSVEFGHLSGPLEYKRNPHERKQHWRVENTGYDGDDDISCHVTHWQPIPDGPK
jgi:hypothetical protein